MATTHAVSAQIADIIGVGQRGHMTMATTHTLSGWMDQANAFLQALVRDIPGSLESLGQWQAALITIPVGIVFLLYGFRVYRFLASVIFAAIGLWIGLFAAAAFDFNWVLGMAVGAIVLALLGWFLVRLAWSLVCGAAGATVVGFAWVYFLGLFESPVHGWLIGGAGFLAGALAGFFFFRLVVIIVTSLQGASGIVWGALKLVALVPSVGKPVMAAVQQLPWLLLVAVLVPAVVGAIMQWNDTKSMPKVPGKARRAAAKVRPKAAEDED